MKHDLKIYSLFFCLICYSKEIFLFDEELVIITCLFIVFATLFELASDAMTKMQMEEASVLQSLYRNRMKSIISEIRDFRVRVTLIDKRFPALLLGICCTLTLTHLTSYIANHRFLLFLYMKLVVNEFLLLFLLKEEEFVKNVEIFFSLNFIKEVYSLLYFDSESNKK